MAQPTINRAGSPKTTKKSAGSQVISAGVSSIFIRNSGTASASVRRIPNQNMNGALFPSRWTTATSIKAPNRFSLANQACRKGRYSSTAIRINPPSSETSMPAFEEMFEARIIRPTGINNQSRVPAKPLAPSQNRNGNRSSVMVFQRASRALENLLDECSQWIKSTGAGHIKWRSLPPRSTAHVIWREVSPVTTQSPTLHPSDPLGFTIKAESRIAVRRRVGQSSSQMPKTTPPICPALCIPMKPSRSRPVRATVPLICNKYPRLIKLTTGIAETTAKPKIKETIPKHQPVAE